MLWMYKVKLTHVVGALVQSSWRSVFDHINDCCRPSVHQSFVFFEQFVEGTNVNFGSRQNFAINCSVFEVKLESNLESKI